MSIYINKNELMRAIPSEEINARMAVAYMHGIEIIRCKDCNNEDYGYCHYWERRIEENGFCYKAERRTENERNY